MGARMECWHSPVPIPPDCQCREELLFCAAVTVVISPGSWVLGGFPPQKGCSPWVLPARHCPVAQHTLCLLQRTTLADAQAPRRVLCALFFPQLELGEIQLSVLGELKRLLSKTAGRCGGGMRDPRCSLEEAY